MKSMSTLFAGAIAVVAIGCASTPKENDQQAFEADLSETTLFMKTLTNMDSGDIAKARRIAEIPVFVDISSLQYFATNGHATPEQKQEMVVLARQVLDYMFLHRSELEPKLPSVQMAMRGLQEIFTEPKDMRRLQELADYFADEKKPISN